jgi:branched-chain amino acid transport system ATP-binding protein
MPATVREVSLRVEDGEAVCLVGRNGAGKTTTIDSIMGLLPVRSGRVAFRDRDITRLPAHQRALLGIGYAPEDCGIFPDLSVEENFQITSWIVPPRANARRGGDERVFSVFPEVKGFMTRRGLHLSGGQKKMVAITRAMSLAPSVLLLDEPFEGLAPVVVTRFIEAVRTIKAMGISVLIAESNLVNATRVCDRLYAIDRGEIIFEGNPRDVFSNEDVMRTIRG